MGPLDATVHLLGMFMPALSAGLIAGLLAKALWRRELAAVSWQRLVLWPALAGSAALLGGLLMLGRDGRMLSYLAMIVVSAVALWWVGFGSARR